MGGLGRRALVVDDNAIMRTIVGRILREAQFDIVEATNGAEALRQARELSPDVALVDISLGTESGFDVAREINPYVGSVILISSDDHYADDDYAELIAGSPAVGFLSKATLSADAISRLVA